MKKILNKCTIEDYEYLSEILGSRFSLIDDKGRSSLLDCYKENPTEENKKALVNKIDSQIKYYAQADFAYLYRKVLNKNEILANEMIADIAKKLKVKIKIVSSIEANLERLVNSVVEKEFINKSPKDLATAFKKMNLTADQIDEIMQEISKIGRIAVIPVLIRILGKDVVITIVETIIISFMARIVGREAAKALVKQIGKRNPLINALGPIAWAISATWILIDIQGPAYRKTIPTCLYLGVVALRDGLVGETENGEE